VSAVSVRDVTEQTLAREALSASQQSLSLVLEMSPGSFGEEIVWIVRDAEQRCSRLFRARCQRSSRSRHGIIIVTELQPDLPKVSADHVQMQQVLVNLVQNANRCDGRYRFR
jgi:signal transduction histidine kinase